jgi:hypothetical protein
LGTRSPGIADRAQALEAQRTREKEREKHETTTPQCADREEKLAYLRARAEFLRIQSLARRSQTIQKKRVADTESSTAEAKWREEAAVSRMKRLNATAAVRPVAGWTSTDSSFQPASRLFSPFDFCLSPSSSSPSSPSISASSSPDIDPDVPRAQRASACAMPSAASDACARMAKFSASIPVDLID